MDEDVKDVVWHSKTTDEFWRVEVERTGDLTGDFVVTKALTNEEVHREPVRLAYGAVLGPDTNDIARWLTMAEQVIENQEQP